MDRRICKWQRKIKLVQRLVNQLNYHPSKYRVRQINNQIKALLEYLADDVVFTKIERRKNGKEVAL